MGPYLSEPRQDIETRTGSNKLVKFTCSQMQGWRKSMEDATITELEVKADNGKCYSVFGVFDGHGGTLSNQDVGPEVSKYVSNHFVNELKKNQAFKSGDIAKALQQTFRRMDEMMQTQEAYRQLNEIRKTLNGTGTGYDQKIGGNTGKLFNNIGCTANVVVFDDKNYYVANSGDSRAALCRGHKLVILSEDHKPEGRIQKQRIEKAGGVIMNGRVNGGLNLTRALGDFEYKNTAGLSYHQQMITCHPDVIVVSRQPDDEFIIMGCDGVWQRYVNDSQHMIDYLVSQRNMQIDSKIMLENMLKGMLAKGTSEEIGCDNMSTILIEFVKS